jgi:hypothetical protein
MCMLAKFINPSSFCSFEALGRPEPTFRFPIFFLNSPYTYSFFKLQILALYIQNCPIIF